ncbi:MAG: sugar transferase [Planctomycetota bacterium]
MKPIGGRLRRFLVPRGPVSAYRRISFFHFLTILSDLASGLIGVAAAWHLRGWAIRQEIIPPPDPASNDLYIPIVAAYYATAFLVLFHYVDVYRDRRFITGNREAGRIFHALFVFSLMNIALSFFFPRVFRISPLVMALAFLFSSLLVLAGRRLISCLRHALRERGFDTRAALFLGSGRLAERLAAELSDTRRYGYRFVGCLSDDSPGGAIPNAETFEEEDRLEEAIRGRRVEEVILCGPEWDAGRVVTMLTRLRPLGVRIRLVSRVFNEVIRRTGVPCDGIEGLSILDFDPRPLPPWQRAVRRGADVLGSLLALVLAGPLMAAIALAVRLESGRPVLFCQERVGRAFRLFPFYKFRSMRVGAEKMRAEMAVQNEMEGAVFKIRNDPRLTRTGRILRKYSLDELPQFVNILRGEMSLVGPRPPLPDEVDRYQEWHWMRLSGPMGLTGLWQVSGRNELDFDDMALCDIYYLWNQSLLLDLRILVRTLPAILLGQGH